ncbi:hypothetical protein FB451DRAFT_1465156 [Mycena latifolia]|nr:hypothetical protein FB451DRAFT_1465156 [Mycena latifolia]
MRLFFLLPFSALLLVDALLNVTIDDVSPMIAYAGKWEPSGTHRSGLDYGGSHTLSSDDQASATLVFTDPSDASLAPGVAVYYLSPRWPYAVSTRLSLDGAPPILLNLTDPITSPSPPGGSESAQSAVVWSATGLANKSHTLVATIGNYIVVDGFIFTIDDGSPTSSSSSSSSSSSTLSSSSAASSSTSASMSSSATLAASSAGTSVVPSSHKGLTIGLATALALSVVVAAALFGFAWFQRRRHGKARSARPRPVFSDWGSTQRGRGTYAAVDGGGAHALEMSDSSSSGLLNTYPPTAGLSDPWEPQGSSAASRMPSSVSQGSSVSSYGRVRYAAELPPGAMPAAVPGPYIDRVPPDHDEGPLLLTRAAVSEPLLSSDPIEDGEWNGVRISSPPAYSPRGQ